MGNEDHDKGNNEYFRSHKHVPVSDEPFIHVLVVLEELVVAKHIVDLLHDIYSEEVLVNKMGDEGGV